MHSMIHLALANSLITPGPYDSIEVWCGKLRNDAFDQSRVNLLCYNSLFTSSVGFFSFYYDLPASVPPHTLLFIHWLQIALICIARIVKMRINCQSTTHKKKWKIDESMVINVFCRVCFEYDGRFANRTVFMIFFVAFF